MWHSWIMSEASGSLKHGLERESISDQNDQEINTREADTEDIPNKIEQLCRLW